MLFNKCVLATLCLAAVLSLAPSVTAVPQGLLSLFADKTICESVVEFNENPNRVPRLIKEVKCAANPDKTCPAHDGSGKDTSCCSQNSHGTYKFSCREVIDTVLVKIEDVTTQETVSVGCACIMQTSASGEDVS